MIWFFPKYLHGLFPHHIYVCIQIQSSQWIHYIIVALTPISLCHLIGFILLRDPQHDLSWMNLSLYCLSPPLKCKLTEKRDSCLFGSLPYPPLRNRIWCTLNAQSVKGMNDWPLCCLWNPHESDGWQQPLPLWPLPRFPHSLAFILRPQSFLPIQPSSRNIVLKGSALAQSLVLCHSHILPLHTASSLTN